MILNKFLIFFFFCFYLDVKDMWCQQVCKVILILYSCESHLLPAGTSHFPLWRFVVLLLDMLITHLAVKGLKYWSVNKPSNIKKECTNLPDVFPRPLQNHFLSVLSKTTDAGSWIPQYLKKIIESTFKSIFCKYLSQKNDASQEKQPSQRQ